MRILFIASDTKALGGIQQYNRKFLACLRNRGDSVILVEIKKKGKIAGFWFIVKSLFLGVFFFPDVVICAHVNYSFLGFVLKSLSGRKYVVCTHGIDVWNVTSESQKKGLRGAKVITTVAEFTRDKMVAQIPELAKSIYLLYNPIDGAVFVPKEKPKFLIERYGLRGKKMIFTIARLSALEGYKGYDRVIQAMPKILKAVPEAMYILGGKGDDASRVVKLVDETGLQSSVIMVGFVKDEEVVDYYNLADVFVMPSKAEGAPAVFVEALACGIPVIAGNQDGSSTPLQGGDLGLLINPESVDEIADSIIRVLKKDIDPKLLVRDYLRKKTLEKFGIEVFPKRVNEVLQRVLS